LLIHKFNIFALYIILILGI